MNQLIGLQDNRVLDDDVFLNQPPRSWESAIAASEASNKTTPSKSLHAPLTVAYCLRIECLDWYKSVAALLSPTKDNTAFVLFVR